eukprot:gene7850-10658_t
MSSLANEKAIQEQDVDEISEDSKTPVTIITGFLGSGKTTLVNYILKEQNKWKICVVENEFGEVAIDNDLVEENLAAKEDIITMDNGCVCCSVRGDLVRTFAMLVKRRKDFDAIIIETTGLADPAPIVFTFNSNMIIQDNYRIDSVVCLVDAKHINIHLDDIKPEDNINEAEHQIAFADRILLNKVDLVTEEELDDVEDRIKSMNSFATLVRTNRSRVPLDQILGLNSFSLSKVVEVDPSLMDMDDVEEEHEDDGHVHDENCGHNVKGHHDDHEHSHGHDSDHVHDEHCGHDTKGHHDDHEHGHGHDSDHVHDEHCGHDTKGHHDEHGHEHNSEHMHDEHCDHHDHHDKGHHDDHEHGHDHSSDHSHKEHAKHDEGHDHHHKHAKKQKKTHNLSLISSVGFTIQGQLDVALFNTFMSQLLKEKGADLYRTKGVLFFANQGDSKFVFQGVHEQINFGPADKPWVEGEPRLSKLVFIGKKLDYEYFKTSLLSCAEDPSTAVVTMHKRA